VLSDDQSVTEFTATQLARNVPAALTAVRKGKRVVVTRHGRPVAVMVSLGEGVDLALAGSEHFALLRREAREELEAGVARALDEWRSRGFRQ
jgi:prevent-host-death family protein